MLVITALPWILGPEKNKFRAYDDGEPNHSAGDPILGQIRSRDLTNVLVVIVRYFGGVKLGIAGLTAAFKLAAEDALYHAVILEQEVVEHGALNYDYAATPEVMKLVKEFDLKIIRQEFVEMCILEIEISLRNKPGFLEKIKLLGKLGQNIRCMIEE